MGGIELSSCSKLDVGVLTMLALSWLKLRSCVVLVLLALFASALNAAPAAPSFTVDEVEVGTRKLVGRYHVSGDRIREERLTAEDAGYEILLFGSRELYRVTPFNKSYEKVTPIPTASTLSLFPAAIVLAKSAPKVREEKVAGELCSVFMLSDASPYSSRTMTAWISHRTGWPVQVQNEIGPGSNPPYVVRYSNFKEGPQDPALFAPPAGYAEARSR